MKTLNKASTKDHILDIAERHFAVYGFAGTSLRGIIKEAKINVAAIAYHFGDKESLFTAVIERFALPVVQQQLECLDAEMAMARPKLTNVLLAFYKPPIEHVKRLRRKGETLALFLGRAQTEPEPVYSLIDKHYSFCRNRFIEAFRRVLPGFSDADYQWQFEFMLSLIVCFLTRQKPIRQRTSDTGDWEANEALNRLLAFCESGIRGVITK